MPRSPLLRALDMMSVRDWIEPRVPHGPDSRIGRLLDVAHTVGHGADSTDQSALNRDYLLSGSSARRLELLGASLPRPPHGRG